MIFKQKIPCYVLLYEQVEIIKRTLDFLTQYTDKIDIILIENPSVNTPKIKTLVNEYKNKGLIERYYLFDENITGNALGVVLDQESIHIKKCKYIIVTDGDIESSNTNWIDEQTSTLKKHSDIFTCGISLDMANLPLQSFPEAKDWIPPDINVNEDYIEALTGAHLLLFRGKDMVNFLKWKNKNDLSFVDGNMHKYCYDVIKKKWARTKKSAAVHLTWNLYHDRNHPYTKFKLEKSFQDTWYHKKNSTYVLEKY